jgi:hypothetical protein
MDSSMFLNLGLRCYTCDSEASGDKCITDPGGLTQVTVLSSEY